MPGVADRAKECETTHRLRVLDRDDVEQTVAGIRLRRDDESAAEPPAIRDREQEQGARTVAVPGITRQRTVAKNLLKSREAVSQRAPERGAV